MDVDKLNVGDAVKIVVLNGGAVLPETLVVNDCESVTFFNRNVVVVVVAAVVVELGTRYTVELKLDETETVPFVT